MKPLSWWLNYEATQLIGRIPVETIWIFQMSIRDNCFNCPGKCEENFSISWRIVLFFQELAGDLLNIHSFVTERKLTVGGYCCESMLFAVFVRPLPCFFPFVILFLWFLFQVMFGRWWCDTAKKSVPQVPLPLNSTLSCASCRTNTNATQTMK